MKKFVWDENKHKINIQKHGVSFIEAMTVFDDEKALYEFDDEHSMYEDRFVIMGLSAQTRVLVVCHCFKESDNTIRIISARKATKQELNQYGGAL